MDLGAGRIKDRVKKGGSTRGAARATVTPPSPVHRLPPRSYPCFIIALAVLGMLMAVVKEVAHMFGCAGGWRVWGRERGWMGWGVVFGG